MKSLPTPPVSPISGAPTSLSYSFGESPTPIFMLPSPSTYDPRPEMPLFMSLKRGIGPRSTSLLTWLGSCLRGDLADACVLRHIRTSEAQQMRGRNQVSRRAAFD